MYLVKDPERHNRTTPSTLVPSQLVIKSDQCNVGHKSKMEPSGPIILSIIFSRNKRWEAGQLLCKLSDGFLRGWQKNPPRHWLPPTPTPTIAKYERVQFAGTVAELTTETSGPFLQDPQVQSNTREYCKMRLLSS